MRKTSLLFLAFFAVSALLPTMNVMAQQAEQTGVAMPLSLVNTDVKNRNYANRDLTGSTFVNANLTNVDFDGANLTNANFSNVTFNKGTFRNVMLQGASFSNVTFNGTKIWKKDLERATSLVNVDTDNAQ